MRALYGRHYGDRYRAVAGRVADGAEVLDVCCGPGTLYTEHLSVKGVRYRGLDVNERFVARLRRLGVDALVWDLREPIELPPADIVVMQASLYHFLPDPHPIIERMLAATRQQLVIAEPVRNLSASRFRLLAALGRRLTRVAEAGGDRFDEPALDALMARYAPAVVDRFLIPGGREKVYVLDPARLSLSDVPTRQLSDGGKGAGGGD
jgi:SAM-dependent methyltransferase